MHWTHHAPASYRLTCDDRAIRRGSVDWAFPWVRGVRTPACRAVLRWRRNLCAVVFTPGRTAADLGGPGCWSRECRAVGVGVDGRSGNRRHPVVGIGRPRRPGEVDLDL